MAAVPLSVYLQGVQSAGAQPSLSGSQPLSSVLEEGSARAQGLPPPIGSRESLAPAEESGNADAGTAFTAARLLSKGAGLLGYDSPYIGPGLDLAELAVNPTPRGAFKAGMNLLPAAGRLAGNFLSAGAPSGVTASGLTATEAALAGGEAAAGAAVPAAESAATGLAGGLSAGLAMAPFMLFAGGGPLKFLETMSGPDDAHRARRTLEAQRLQAPLVAPLIDVKRPQDLTAAFATRVGDTTVGDTLAAILKYNREGTWFSDTSHDWLPNRGLDPLRTALAAQGYTGDREPTMGDVGGVGEIVAGAGDRLLPMDRINDLSMTRTSDGRLEPTGDPRSGPSGAALGAEGWETVMRRLTSVLTGTPMEEIPATTAFLRRQGVPNEGGGYVDSSSGEWREQPTRPETDEEMLGRLGLDPGKYARILEERRITEEMMRVSPGGGE